MSEQSASPENETPPASEVEAVAEVVPQERESPRIGMWLLAGAFVMFVMFVGLLLCSGLAYFAWQHFNGREDDGHPHHTPLVERIEAAMPGPKASEHAVYFSKVCAGIAPRLESDGKVAESEYDTRGEVAELVGIVGQFATAGVDGVQYPAIPGLLSDTLAETLGRNEKGEVAGGPLTATDRAKVVQMWRSLAEAFREAA